MSHSKHREQRPPGMSAREVIKWHTIVDPVTGCWEWQAGKRKGYGWVGFEGRCWPAHKLSYEAWVEPVPEGLLLDHFKCDNPGCANPEHVRPVTHFESLLRNDKTTTAINTAKTHCPRGHPYVGHNLVLVGRGRACRECKRRVAEAINRRNGFLPRVIVTHCKRGHPYAGANVYMSKGQRSCKRCRNLACQRYRARRDMEANAKAWRADVARAIVADGCQVDTWARLRDALAYRARLRELVKRSELEAWARLYGVTPRWSEDTPTLRRRLLDTQLALGAKAKARARHPGRAFGLAGMPRVTRQPGG